MTRTTTRTAEEHRQFAQRYRQTALLVIPQHRQRYLDMAAQHEAQAVGISRPGEVVGGPVGISRPAQVQDEQLPQQPPPPIVLQQQVRIHSRLATAVSRSQQANLDRSFSIWLTLRSTGQTWFYLDDIVQVFSQLTGKAERSVRAWVQAGFGLFFLEGRDQGRVTVSLIGKDRIFAKFGLEIPGDVLLVDTNQLTGKLRQLRAVLYSCWIDKESRWASRSTIRKLTGKAARTQQYYDQLLKTKRQSTFAIDQKAEGPDPNDLPVRQLPNRYHRLHFTPMAKPAKHRRYGLYTSENNRVASAPVTGLVNSHSCCSGPDVKTTDKAERVLFDDAPGAVKAAQRRGKAGQFGQTFSVLETTRRGKILVRSYAYGAIV